MQAVECEICEIPPLANGAQRTSQSVSGLALASECGGSDGYPGNSADPALGYAAVLLVRNGGGVALSETPEMCGGEHLLKGRAASVDVAEKMMARTAWRKTTWRQIGPTLVATRRKASRSRGSGEYRPAFPTLGCCSSFSRQLSHSSLFARSQALSSRPGTAQSSEAQRQVALDTVTDVEASGLWPGKVVTEIE
jgi:hypothetical protein